ncbi:MAG TPA: hypothetical protein VF189_02305 [Patescibacteria group bacterium]
MSDEEKKIIQHSHEEKKNHGFVAKRSWWQRIRDFNFHSFFATASYGRTLTLIGILLIIIALPVTVVVLQQRTQTQQHAALYCSPETSYSCGMAAGNCSNISTAISSSHYVRVDTGSTCKNYCTDLGQVAGHCGICIAKVVDTYCKGTTKYVGTQDKYCKITYTSTANSPSCGYNPPPTVDPNSCLSKGGTCAKYSCPSGKVLNPKGGTCGIDQVCCVSGTQTYSCIYNHLSTIASKDASTPNNGYQTTGGDSGFCAGNQYCSDAGKQQSSLGGVCHNIDPNSCSCTGKSSFTCNNGYVQRSCGTGYICSNSTKGAQGGLWPCTQDISLGCNTFRLDNPSGATVTNAMCQQQAAKSAPQCKAPQYYKLSQYVGNPATDAWDCVFNDSTACTLDVGACEKYQCASGEGVAKSSSGNTYSCAQGPEFVCCAKTPSKPPSPSPMPSCSSLHGTCYANHSCPTNSNEVTASCPSGTYVCCTPKTTPKPTGSGGGTGGGSSCTNGKSTSMTLSLKFEGIGTGSFENHSPAHTTRNAIYTKVTDKNNSTIYNNSSEAFSHSNGRFNASKVGLGTGLVCSNTYKVTVKIPRYLPASATVTYGTDSTINLNPIAGDINKVDLSTKVIVGDDKIDINDYAIVRACHNVAPNTPQTFTSGSNTVSLTCSDLMNFFDYPDGGTQGDEWSFNYNLWLRGFLRSQGK